MEEMDQVKLIENVRFYESLYVTTHAQYSDIRFKEYAWKEIGRKMKLPAALCKKTWTNLRDSFRRAVRKRRESRSGRIASKIRKWKFEDEMSFLRPHLQGQEIFNNSEKDTGDKNDDEVDEDWADDNDDSGNYYRDVNEDGDENAATDDDNVYENEYDNLRVKEEEITSREATNRKIARPVAAVMEEHKIAPKSVLIECTLENERKINAKKREEACNAIDTLFASIASTVKSFSPYYQNIAKSQVFKIITDLEMEQIMQSRQEFEFPNTSMRRPSYGPMSTTISTENPESYHTDEEPQDLPSTPNPPSTSQNLSCSVWEETYHTEELIKKE